MIEISMRTMLEAGVHFGHQARHWNPKMAPYIYGVRHKIHIINLEKTVPLFQKALEFVVGVTQKRGKILMVGTKHAAREIIKEEATRCGMPYIDYRWTGGILTNYKTIRQSIKRLKELEEQLGDEAQLVGMTKKEVLQLMREKEKLSANLAGIKNMGGLPDALFVVDVNHEKIAVQEAKRLSIPVIGIVDTNSDPTAIDYVIPGNDDALRSIQFYTKTIADLIIETRDSMTLADIKSQPEPKKDKKAQKIITKKSKMEKSTEEKAASSASEGSSTADVPSQSVSEE